MAEKSKKQTKKPKVMDVAKPGKSAPSASSRPIIVGHKPTVHDPMVNEDKEMPSGESEEHKIDVKRTGPKVIAPISPVEDLKEDKEADTPDSTDPPEATESSETPSDESNESEMSDDLTETAPEPEPEVDEDTSEPEPETEEPVEPEEATDEATGKESKDKKDSKDKGSSIVDAVAGQAVKNKDKKADKKNEELQKRLAEIEKLVDEKKYFVPTSSTTKKERKTRWAILLLSLALLAGAYLAFDAQLIKNDYWLPYHFFKEEKKQSESSSATPASNTDKNRQDSQSETEEYKVPKGYVIYENKDLGFKFAYPEEWGKMTETPDENNVKILKSEEPEQKYGPGINGAFSIFTYASATQEITARKYGPKIQLQGGKWIVTETNELDTVGNKVGDVYLDFEKKVPASQDNNELTVYTLKSGDEGSESYRIVFVAKGRLHEIHLPAYSDGLYGNPDGAAKQNDKTKFNELLSSVRDSVRLAE